jgi:hypothetical protein
MKKVVETIGNWLFGIFLLLAVPGLLAVVGAVATLFLVLGAVAVDAMALRIAALDTMCGIYTGDAFLSCSADPWFRVLVLFVTFGIGTGLYYGFALFKDVVGLTPAATEPGDGNGKPHREADTSTDPRWQMLRMAAHIAWLRARYPETLEEHDCYLSVGDNAIIADYTVSHYEAWTATANAGLKPPSDFAPPHPKRPE